jgi:hypothetical protein
MSTITHFDFNTIKYSLKNVKSPEKQGFRKVPGSVTRVSVPLINGPGSGSGSGSWYFRQWLSRC